MTLTRRGSRTYRDSALGGGVARRHGWEAGVGGDVMLENAQRERP